MMSDRSPTPEDGRIIGPNRTGVKGENRREGGPRMRAGRTDGFSGTNLTEGGPSEGRDDGGG